jgi:exopolyphosphatase/guanosine-5'-triphosphate,3'-diphosphate pyrophosphatase
VVSEAQSDSVAAVDLGSNSFHMMIARIVRGGELHVVDRLREQVQLAAGLEHGRIHPVAEARALACLERFGQRLRDLPRGHVRAVGTNTLRQAREPKDFLVRAHEALGHPIEVLPGLEEARLIYLGAAHDLADDRARRLVVDIGGGSTECIIGERFEPIAADSLHMGCVSYSQRFFPDGRITRERMKQAIIAARLELQSMEVRYRELGWSEAVGTSGTANSIAAIVRANGWSAEGITPRALKKLRKALVAAGKVENLALPGLAPDRTWIINGGVAILSAIFESLGVETMTVANGALREGLAYDLVGRIQHEDVRDRTIDALMERYTVDREQAKRVERTARSLLEQAWEPLGLHFDQAEQVLTWASRLHEIGIAVAYSGYHKHGAYLLSNSDLPGFSREGRALLAALVLGHRRKVRRSTFAALSATQAELAQKLCVLLRLAVLLNRGRSPRSFSDVRLKVSGARLSLRFPPRWLDEHPLTRADLENEAVALRKGLGYELTFE